MLLAERPGNPLDVLNFRQGEFAFRGRIRGDYAPLRTTFILAGSLAALLVLSFVVEVGVNAYRLIRVNGEIESVAAPVLGSVDADEAVPRLRESIVAMRKRLIELGGNAEINSPLDTLLALSRDVPAHVPVELTEVEIDGGGLKATGGADSFATVEQFKQALENSDYFGEVEISNARASSGAERVEFRLSASLRDGFLPTR
jgi:hypothetical protein